MEKLGKCNSEFGVYNFEATSQNGEIREKNISHTDHLKVKVLVPLVEQELLASRPKFSWGLCCSFFSQVFYVHVHVFFSLYNGFVISIELLIMSWYLKTYMLPITFYAHVNSHANQTHRTYR